MLGQHGPFCEHRADSSTAATVCGLRDSISCFVARSVLSRFLHAMISGRTVVHWCNFEGGPNAILLELSSGSKGWCSDRNFHWKFATRFSFQGGNPYRDVWRFACEANPSCTSSDPRTSGATIVVFLSLIVDSIADILCIHLCFCKRTARKPTIHVKVRMG